MAVTVSLAEAAAALHDHFGPRLEAGRDDGRGLMADALRDRFGISGRAARKLVEELEQASTIRYLSDTSPTEAPSGFAPSAGLAPGLVGWGPSEDYGGYWQLSPGG
jgi:hypothetical protein